jgi:DNA-binding MarR family transcriptional regulator
MTTATGTPTREKAAGTSAVTAAGGSALMIIRLARMTGYRMGRALAELEMRTHEFGVLDHLNRAGPISQQQLGTALRIDPSNLVGLLDDLQQDGLVVRARDAADRRRHLVGLTDKGHARLESAKRATAEAEADLLAPLNAAERKQFLGVLERLTSHACSGPRGAGRRC